MLSFESSDAEIDWPTLAFQVTAGNEMTIQILDKSERTVFIITLLLS